MCDFAPKVFTSIQTLIRGQANLRGLSCHSEKRRPMLSAHIASFLKLIGVQLEETSRGIRSIHHFHNVECGIANILSLLEPNSEVVEKADQLSRKASSYIAPLSSLDGQGWRWRRRRRSSQCCSRGARRFSFCGRAQSAELQS